MKYTIYRGSEVVVADVEIQGSVSEKIMGEETASLTFSAYDKIDFHIGDKITIFGRDYFLQEDPITEKVNSRLYNYTLTFYSLKYTLADAILFFYDENNDLTIPDFDLMGNASTCLDLIISNLNADPLNDGWTKGTVDDTEVKLISFASINCLEAISKLAEEFELEYWIDSNKSIHFTERKPVSGYSFAYGQAQGLRNIKRSILDGGSLCTRLYVKGGTQNLPKNYRSGQKNLRIDVPYLEKNVNIYGRKSHIETFEDVYPKYEGTVTAVSSTDPNIFTDANLNFDLNAYNEYGTTVLKAGVPAKIIFQTGQLAGYTIELLEAGGFISSTKTFYLNRVKDEANLVVPSELLRPAIGDKYIIVDIMMPETYVLAAETLLKTKAQEYLDKNSRERFQYAVVSDPFYFEAQNVNILLGSTVHFIDSDFGLDDDLRVIGKKTNVQDRYSVELELSEETQVSSIVRNYYAQQKSQTTVTNNIKYNAELARRNYLFGREFHDKVFDGEDYFKAENIKPLSIETKMLSLGSRLQQFGLPGVSFKIENNNTLVNTSGKIAHQTINPDAVREWNIAANSVTGISNNFNYIFIKCQKVGTNASFVVSETPIKVEADADFYHFEVGYLSSIIDGYRKIKTTYGFAQLNPAELSIGRIADPSGNNFIELKEDGIDISAKVIFKSGSIGYDNLTDKPDLSSFEHTRDYVNSTLQTDLNDLKNRADGVIESWFYSHTPTLSNLPASNWVTTAERNAHIGDTFTNMQEFVNNVTTPDAGKAWRFVKNETTGEFSWSLIANSDSTKALIEAGKAKDTADAKRRVFVSQPYPPYNIGDLWVQGNGGDIMRCKFERLSGSYVATDFEKASKYTDDTAVNNLQIGGRNFLRNSKNFAGLTNWNINGNPVITQNDDSITLNLPENTASVGMWQPLDLGGYIGDITISFDALSTNAGWNADLSIGIEGKIAKIGFGINDVTTWTRFSFTLNLSTATNSCVFIFYKGNNAYPLGIKLRNIKLEKGNKATDWTPAPEDVEASILQSKTDSIASAKAYSDAQDALRKTEAAAYADGVVTAAEQRLITDATNKAEAAKTYAAAQDALLKTQLESYADGVVDAEEQARINQAQSNLNAAKAYADAQDNLAKIAANAYADGIVDAEEARAIADATAKMEEAKNHAQTLVNNVQIGGRNLLLKSNVSVNINNISPNYNQYWIGLSELAKIDNIQKITYYTLTLYYESLGNNYVEDFGSVVLGKISDIFDNWSIRFYYQNAKIEPIGNGVLKAVITIKAEIGSYIGNNQFGVGVIIESNNNGILLHRAKLEEGNKATDWTPAPEDVDSAISTAQNSANTANNLLADIANDNILTPSEKQSTKKEWDIIVGEKSVVESQATALGLSATSYVNAYISLDSYLTPLLADLTVNSTIVGADFRANFKNYYDSKIALLKAVTDKLKSNTDVLKTQLDSESAKVINLENKTDFLTGTTIEGNAVATGTLLVGNSDGTNAGITGLGDRGSASVRIWAGATFAGKNTAKWLMRDDGVEEQWFNGILVRQRGVINGAYVETWYNLNGQIGKRITFSTDGKILEEWYNNGTLVYQIGQNGIYYVSEIPESFSLYRLVNLNSNTATSDGSIFHNKLRRRMWQKTSNPEQFELRGDKDSYLYNAGQNIYSQGNKQYEGYKNTQSYYDNIADGWYAFEQLGGMVEGINPTKRLVDLMRVSGGKVAQQIETNVETNGYAFNQF